MVSCHLPVEHKVPQCQAVGVTPLGTLVPWQGLHFIELALLALFGLYAAVRSLFSFYFNS